ncbi:hypothetical protein DERF_008360 [Dermatophagoides farinae]|uniref:Uncharacterized protein n=1 Tax=Dermatophagoides farinae TaxID=6954 RepID=A0A922I392_DERFA|nr:hypothetical protein DERF_008360 [Dermatophagoides farinae]
MYIQESQMASCFISGGSKIYSGYISFNNKSNKQSKEKKSTRIFYVLYLDTQSGINKKKDNNKNPMTIMCNGE